MGSKDRNIKTRETAQEKAAKHFRTQSTYAWGDRASIDNIPIIEELLNISINILDLNNLPLLNTTGYTHESMIYKSSYDKSKLTCWLLFGNIPYGAITSIKGFLADRHFARNAVLVVISKRP